MGVIIRLFWKEVEEMKRNITRRLLVLIMIVSMMALCLAGCGGSSNESAVQKTVEGVLNALQAGDIDGITEYATEDILMNGDLAEFRDMTEFTEDMLASLGVDRENISDEAIASIDKLGETLLTGFVESYTIDEVTEEENAGNVTCTINFGYDADALDENQMSTEVTELVQKYAEENMDELVKVYQDEGEDALTNKLVSACMPMICDKMSEFLAESEGYSGTFEFKVENQDGKWVVTEAKPVA